VRRTGPYLSGTKLIPGPHIAKTKANLPRSISHSYDAFLKFKARYDARTKCDHVYFSVLYNLLVDSLSPIATRNDFEMRIARQIAADPNILFDEKSGSKNIRISYIVIQYSAVLPPHHLILIMRATH
jgi:hypothetical protein